jgi:hypothetical protein
VFHTSYFHRSLTYLPRPFHTFHNACGFPILYSLIWDFSTFWDTYKHKNMDTLQEFIWPIWQKCDEILLIWVSYRAPWFGHTINRVLSISLSSGTIIHVGFHLLRPPCHVGFSLPRHLPMVMWFNVQVILVKKCKLVNPPSHSGPSHLGLRAKGHLTYPRLVDKATYLP